jgi:hypothetical protein
MSTGERDCRESMEYGVRVRVDLETVARWKQSTLGAREPDIGSIRVASEPDIVSIILYLHRDLVY